MSDWQPIDTVPKDGSSFLIAYDDGTVRAGFYLNNTGKWPFKGVRPHYGIEHWNTKVVAWMPLPRPPKTPPREQP